MLISVAIIFGLVGCSQVLGTKSVWDGHKWLELRGGLDPDLIKRHVYVLSEFCAKDARKMDFGDEIIVESQRPWQKVYPPGRSCVMNFTKGSSAVGMIVNVLKSETPDCTDFLRISPSESASDLFCGPRVNVTGNSYYYENETIEIEWKSAPRSDDSRGPMGGFAVLLTAFQKDCFNGQACFPCANGYIIDQLHMCNGYDNCGDLSDEANCAPPPTPAPSTETSHAGYTALSVLLFFALVALVAMGAFTYKLYQQRNRLLIPHEQQREDMFAEARA